MRRHACVHWLKDKQAVSDGLWKVYSTAQLVTATRNSTRQTMSTNGHKRAQASTNLHTDTYPGTHTRTHTRTCMCECIHTKRTHGIHTYTNVHAQIFVRQIFGERPFGRVIHVQIFVNGSCPLYPLPNLHTYSRFHFRKCKISQTLEHAKYVHSVCI